MPSVQIQRNNKKSRPFSRLPELKSVGFSSQSDRKTAPKITLLKICYKIKDEENNQFQRTIRLEHQLQKIIRQDKKTDDKTDVLRFGELLDAPGDNARRRSKRQTGKATVRDEHASRE
jgi:hypothetical protein